MPSPQATKPCIAAAANIVTTSARNLERWAVKLQRIRRGENSWRILLA